LFEIEAPFSKGFHDRRLIDRGVLVRLPREWQSLWMPDSEERW